MDPMMNYKSKELATMKIIKVSTALKEKVYKGKKL